MKNTRVVIVEDDIPLRKSLSDWLSQDHEVSEYESAEAFLADANDFLFEDGTPTCMLLDFQMQGMNGVELQQTLRKINVEFPIVFMSGNAQQVDIVDAWRGGAVDFILKPFSGDQVSECLTKVFAKATQITFDSRSTKKELEWIDIPISPREAEVLLLLGQGHRQVEVAQMLGIGLRTVKMYRTNLKNKLNLNTPVELSRFCDQYFSSITKILDKASK
jgi:FixJ family two-component response regulator